MNIDGKKQKTDAEDSTVSTTTTALKENDCEEEEETLVLLQFTDLDDANYSQQFSKKFKTINIENKTPIIQIGNRFYSGEYINNIGTYLFFEEERKSQPVNNNTNNTSSETSANFNNSTGVEFNYSGKSFKKLLLTRLFVEEKENPATQKKD